MAKKTNNDISEFIVPLRMNGLRGRMLRLPAKDSKTREILLVPGLHTSLERLFGLAEAATNYGAVTLPDLPGFGGMESFYKIGKKPSLDDFADYLAAFIKLRYKRRKVTIMAFSFGFLVTTKMLQKYPELAKKVDILISTVGFTHHEDFKFTKSTFMFFRYGSSFFSNRLPAAFLKYFVLRSAIIRLSYKLVEDSHAKLQDADAEERKKRVDFEVGLWKDNDIRTYMDVVTTMLTVNICDHQVDLPVYHVAVTNDRYFDNKLVEQHLKVIYKKVAITKSKTLAHAPTVIANASEAKAFIPPAISKLLK